VFQNNHIWDIWLKASILEIPEGQKHPIIPGSSIKGNVRSFLENRQE
jgi:CRISPR/Cas system CSM-associated protein Csm3 (group 7 of RAMP superfamily)